MKQVKIGRAVRIARLVTASFIDDMYDIASDLEKANPSIKSHVPEIMMTITQEFLGKGDDPIEYDVIELLKHVRTFDGNTFNKFFHQFCAPGIRLCETAKSGVVHDIEELLDLRDYPNTYLLLPEKAKKEICEMMKRAGVSMFGTAGLDTLMLRYAFKPASRYLTHKAAKALAGIIKNEMRIDTEYYFKDARHDVVDMDERIIDELLSGPDTNIAANYFMDALAAMDGTEPIYGRLLEQVRKILPEQVAEMEAGGSDEGDGSTDGMIKMLEDRIKSARPGGFSDFIENQMESIDDYKEDLECCSTLRLYTDETAAGRTFSADIIAFLHDNGRRAFNIKTEIHDGKRLLPTTDKMSVEFSPESAVRFIVGRLDNFNESNN